MNPEQWNELEELFDSARKLTPSERDAFVDDVMGRDPELGAELKGLLAYEPLAAGFLEDEVKPSTDIVGQEISHYRIVEKIGAGGMGEVYLADDLDLPRRVALKMLPSEFAGDPVRLRRLNREAKAAGGLNHPNIATIHMLEQWKGLRFIVMEYVEGQALSTIIRGRAIAIAEGVNIATQIAHALAAAHSKGIIHRDVKPANIMVGDDGHVKVLDFGVAKRFHTESTTGKSTDTDSGSQILVGTIEYMSPEQARGQKVDYRSDIFSLGIVLYEILTGRLPFSADTPLDTLHNICNVSQPPLRSLNNKVSPELEYVVGKCLEKDLNLRYQSAQELVIDLTNLSRAVPEKLKGQRRNDLPSRGSSFIGRNRDMKKVRAMLDYWPFVCLSGPAGVGKSRLAIQLAAELSSKVDVYYVDLCRIEDESGTHQAISRAIFDEPPLEKGFPTIKQVLESNPNSLLLLDNCDRIMPHFMWLIDDLSGLRRTKIGPLFRVLFTSRVEVAASHIGAHRMRGLPIPDPRRDLLAKDVRAYESVKLFADRANRARKGFKVTDQNAALVADICRRLDGLPLAIELAAARLRAVSLDQLSQRLGLRLLSAGASSPSHRHQGLEAAIEWSYSTLTEDERVLLNRLCVADDWSLEAAEVLCAGGPIKKESILDLLTRLSDKSLITIEERNQKRYEIVRYQILQTVREYGIARLKENSEYDEVISRYSHHFLDLKRVSLPWLYLESTNLRHALAWAAENEPVRALEFALRMWRFWFVRKGMIATALEHIAQRALEDDQPARACTLWSGANVLRRTTVVTGFEEEEFATAQKLAFLRNRLGDAEFEEWWDRGAKLTLEDLIAYALRTVRPLPATIEIIVGNITEQTVDAIVNAANGTLLGASEGIDGAIHLAAGPGLREECGRLGGCKTGEAKLTAGHRLPAKFVIHTVGPFYGKENGREAELLANCYRNVLAIAENQNIKSIAFPAIATGTYAYPLAEAARIAIETVFNILRTTQSKVERVVFVTFSEEAYRVYNDAYRRICSESP